MSDTEDSARRAREDADFQRIVEAYGDRPDFPEPTRDAVPEPEPAAPAVPAELDDDSWLDHDTFTPPPAPPVPRPEGLRGLAWFGVLGVPVLVLLTIMVSITLPTFVSLLLLAWFIGGFGYLVATMGSGPSDPDAGWDDGAVL